MSITGGGGAQLLLLVELAPGSNSTGCPGLAVLPVGHTTWFRANDVASDGAHTLSFASHGLGTTTVHSTRRADKVPLKLSVAAAPHLAFCLTAGFRLGLNSGDTPLSLEAIVAALAARRDRELGTYAKYGALAETKMVVQAAVMWQTIYNPIEAGPFAPVIRGNPWGLNRGTVNDDWAYVIFDWDNHFGSLMLSLDAKELGYSALMQARLTHAASSAAALTRCAHTYISASSRGADPRLHPLFTSPWAQVVKAKGAEGFVPNTAAAVSKARHSQPPVGSKVLLQMYKKYREAWVVELLFDDLLDWNGWFHEERRLPPLNLTCLGSEEGVMQDARFESGLDNSPSALPPPTAPVPCASQPRLLTRARTRAVYDDGDERCIDSPTGGRVCGAWNCSRAKGGKESCGSFRDDKMQLYDVGMASMHAMDSQAGAATHPDPWRCACLALRCALPCALIACRAAFSLSRAQALATLAAAIGRTADAAMLQRRADEMRGLVERHLWDESSGAYVNKMPDGRFNRRGLPAESSNP